MKKFLLSAVALLVLIAASFTSADEARAQNVAAVRYDFTSYPVPSGVSPVFELDQSAMLGLLKKNADGSYALDLTGRYYADQTAVSGFVSGLALLYEMPGYTSLNKEYEKNYLIAAISQGTAGTHVPQVTVTGAPKTESAATAQTAVNGLTYIDIDIADQKLTYYVNGVPQLISDVVTGNEKGHHNTPTGTYQLYGKSTNRTLRGADYEAFVRYWMPFYGNYGIHDASWRSSFGGTIYKTNGSHGCVNMPKNTAEALFDSVSVGTTVVIH